MQTADKTKQSGDKVHKLRENIKAEKKGKQVFAHYLKPTVKGRFSLETNLTPDDFVFLAMLSKWFSTDIL